LACCRRRVYRGRVLVHIVDIVCEPGGDDRTIVQRYVRPVVSYFGLLSIEADDDALRRRRVYRGRVLVHIVDVVCEPGGDDRTIVQRYVRRDPTDRRSALHHCAVARRGRRDRTLRVSLTDLEDDRASCRRAAGGFACSKFHPFHCTFRRATAADLGAIRHIYNEGIDDHIATLDDTPKTDAEMTAWWSEHDGRYAVLVAEDKAGNVWGGRR
jgi:hypothetical protein